LTSTGILGMVVLLP